MPNFYTIFFSIVRVPNFQFFVFDKASFEFDHLNKTGRPGVFVHPNSKFQVQVYKKLRKTGTCWSERQLIGIRKKLSSSESFKSGNNSNLEQSATFNDKTLSTEFPRILPDASA